MTRHNIHTVYGQAKMQERKKCKKPALFYCISIVSLLSDLKHVVPLSYKLDALRYVINNEFINKRLQPLIRQVFYTRHAVFLGDCNSQTDAYSPFSRLN